MNKLYLLAALMLALTSCDILTKKRLPGTYHYIGQKQPFQALSKFELTDKKFIMASLVGEAAMDYVVEDGYVYAGPAGSQIRFKIISADTLRNEGTMGFEGTYVRVK
jgi:hypothetical protein